MSNTSAHLRTSNFSATMLFRNLDHLKFSSCRCRSQYHTFSKCWVSGWAAKRAFNRQKDTDVRLLWSIKKSLSSDLRDAGRSAMRYFSLFQLLLAFSLSRYFRYFSLRRFWRFATSLFLAFSLSRYFRYFSLLLAFSRFFAFSLLSLLPPLLGLGPRFSVLSSRSRIGFSVLGPRFSVRYALRRYISEGVQPGFRVFLSSGLPAASSQRSSPRKDFDEFSGLGADFQLNFGLFGSDFSILTADFDEFGVDFQGWMPILNWILDILGRVSRFWLRTSMNLGSIFRSGCRF